MNPFPNFPNFTPNNIPFPEPVTFPYPNTNEYFEPIIDVSSLACELALLTLNIFTREGVIGETVGFPINQPSP